MNFRNTICGLICWVLAYSSVYADSAQIDTHLSNVQSHVSGVSTPDDTAPIFKRMKTASAKALAVRPWTVPKTRFQSLKTTRDSAFTAQTVAPPVTGCSDIAVGSVYSATTPAPGYVDCFEFVTADVTKYVSYVESLPYGEEHDAHLVQVNADGSLTYLDTEADTSQTKIVEAIPGGPVRLLLLVDSESGAGGATFLFEVLGTTGYDAYEPNDSILHPTQLSGYQLLNGNLDSNSDVDYYSIQTDPTQISNELVSTGTTTTQTAQLETSPGAWATLTSGTQYTVSSSAGAALMMRVYDTATTSAPTPPTYTLRVSDAAGVAGFYQFLDTENISHLAPGGENVSRTIVAGVAAYDHTGNIRLPPGEHIYVNVYDTNLGASPVLLTTTDGYTGNPSGNLLATLNIGVCQGSGTTSGQYQTTSVPADHWSITYNPYAYAVAYVASNPPSSINPSSAGVSHFVHICSETYLGRY